MHAQAQHGLPVEAPALSEDPLATRIVVLAVVEDPHVSVVLRVGAKAGQRPGRLADVAFAVAAAERVELHQLAREVLVGRLGVGVGEGEMQGHGRVACDVAQQHGEAAEGAPPKSPVLVEHQRRVLVGSCEVVVPEQRELLLQWPRRAHHPVEPPQDVVPPLVYRVERPAVDPGGRDPGGRCHTPAQQPADRCGLAAPSPMACLTGGGSEARAPEQPPDVSLVPAGAASVPLLVPP